MINRGLFTSNRDDWETPQDFYDRLNMDCDKCRMKKIKEEAGKP